MKTALCIVQELWPVGIGSSALLLAQAGAVDSGWMSLIGNGVTIAVLAWYVIYDVKTRTPAMLAAFHSEQEELRKTFASEQEESRKTYMADQEALRSTHLQSVESLRGAFASEQNSARQAFLAEQAAQRETFHREMAENRQMLFETMKAMRTAVHDVRDTAQTLMGKEDPKKGD